MKYTILFIILFSVVAQAEVIDSFNITGNLTVEDKVIESQLHFQIGDDVNDDQLEATVKKLYATELFAQVSLEIIDGDLAINIHENPVVNKLTIENNKFIKTNEITRAIKLKSHVLFTKEKLKSDILSIIELYKDNGVIDLVVKPYQILLEDNKVDLIYRIEEGERVKIRKIDFVNNEHFSSNMLKTLLVSKEYRFYKFFTKSHYFVKEGVSWDKSLLSRFYFSRGFLEFKIESVVSEFSNGNAYITFIINEGRKYTIKDIDMVSTLQGLDLEDIKSRIKIERDEIFNLDRINQSVLEITSLLHEKGYYSAVVNPDYQVDGDEVTVNYQISEGKKVYVNRINIEGNTHTLDHVIRREIKISAGDSYNSTLNRSRQNIINLGFFDDVGVETSLDSELIDIDIIVKERNTGFANIGGGISSNLGVIGNINVTESNFLGTGDKLSLSLEKASSTLSSSLSFTKPYVFDLPISSGVDLFKDSSDHKSGHSYSSSSYGITLRASYKIIDDLKHLVKYSYKTNNIHDVNDNASQLIKDQAGITSTSLIGYSLVYDKLNNPVKPTNGYLIRFAQDLAGFGGDLYYLRSELSAVRLMTVDRYESIVLQTSFKMMNIDAYNDQEVGIGQRLFMGNNDIRGFKVSGIGPRDIVTGDAVGGKSRLSLSMQADFPLGLPSDFDIHGSVFVDAGTLTRLDSVTENIVDSSNLRASVGFGFSWLSPVGLLRLDFGFPLLKDDHDEVEVMKFNMGSSF